MIGEGEEGGEMRGEDGGCARASVGRAGAAVPGEASWFRKVHRPPDRASLAACDPACSSVVS